MLRLPRFEPVFPKDIEEAVRFKADHPDDSMFVAGGTDVVPKMKRRQFNPKHLVFIRKLDELKGISSNNGTLSIGAGEVLSSIRDSKVVSEKAPAISGAIDKIATVVIQNMGTIGGNLLLDTRCNYYDQNYFWRQSISFCLKKDGDTCWVAPSSPKCVATASSDLTPVLMVMDARVRFISSSDERIIPLKDVYNNDGVNYLKMNKNELMHKVELSDLEDRKVFYKKLRRREAFDFPALGMACSVNVSGGYKDLKFALIGCGSRPFLVEFGDITDFNSSTVKDVINRLYSVGKPLDNTDFNMTWRKHMIKVYAEEIISEIKNS